MKWLLIALLTSLSAQAKVEINTRDDFTAQGLDIEFVDTEFAKSPSQGLRYLFSKMNQMKAKRDPSVNLRFGLTYAEKLAAPFTLEPVLTPDGQLILDLKIAKSLKENPVVIYEALYALKAAAPRDGNILNLVQKIDGKAVGYDALYSYGLPISWKAPHVTHPLEWLELKINAKAGDRLAQRELIEIDLAAAKRAFELFPKSRLIRDKTDQVELKNLILEVAQARGLNLSGNLDVAQTWATYSAARVEQLQKPFEVATNLAREQFREMKNARGNPQREEAKKAFEAAPEKLEALVKRNDRAGVATLLETFLPWEQFSAVETGFWRKWLEAIRHPDFQNAKVLYRGVDEKDKVQAAVDANGKVIGFGFFPTLLTRNQGNYTRRLRSYESMRLKIGSHEGVVTPIKTMPKMASIMFNHAENPIGSPFMSFTNSLSLAAGYTDAGNIAVVRIDERRLFPNIISPFKGEGEFLVPMIVFPDEVLFYPNHPKNHQSGNKIETFVQEAKEKAGIEISKATPLTDASTYAGAFRTFEEINRKTTRASSCRAAF